MRFSLVAVLALASSAIAAPAPNAKLQKEIQSIQITIVNVLYDITQLQKGSLKKDYASGQSQFSVLIPQVSGPQSCSPFVPGKPTTANGAIGFLQQSQVFLQQLSLALMDPKKSAAKSDFHADVCVAWGYYAGVQSFVSK